MQGAISWLIIAVQSRLSAQAEIIREVNEDKGQLDSYNDRPAVSFPCALCYLDLKYDDLNNLTQEGNGELVIRLGFPTFSSASSLLPEAVRKKGLAYADVEHDLVKALHGWTPGGLLIPNTQEFYFHFGTLTRTSAITERRDDGLVVREIRFALRMEDATTEVLNPQAHINSYELHPETLD